MIVMMSLWRNDAAQMLDARMIHLAEKVSVNHEIEWLWAVGDSTDGTESRLRSFAAMYPRIHVINVDTGIIGEDLDTRRIRLSLSATQMFAALGLHYFESNYACLHESDLSSPVDVVDRLLGAGLGQPCAGWPVIDIGSGAQFYDIWAYRHRDGTYFTPSEPRPDSTFRVRGFGSVWIAPTRLVMDRAMTKFAIRELCEQWWHKGVHMYCAPGVEITQPRSLWVPR